MLILHSVEPTEPLHNAQIGGSFYFYTYMKVSFSKSILSPQQHVTLLKERGLSISNEQKAISYLTNIGYFRLSAYFYPLLYLPKQEHHYKNGATFAQVMNMYRFDRKLRLLLFNEIEKIEVAIRSCIVNIACLRFNDLFWLTNKEYFINEDKFNKMLDSIDTELSRTKEDFIFHFKENYLDKYPPAWMIAELIPFGNLIHIYMNLKDNVVKKQIAKHFGLQMPVFNSWLIVLGGLRNMCCHHERMWNRELPIISSEPKKTKYKWIDTSFTDKHKMYYRICMIRYLLRTISPNNSFKENIIALLDKYQGIDIKAMGFNNAWLLDPFWNE